MPLVFYTRFRASCSAISTTRAKGIQGRDASQKAPDVRSEKDREHGCFGYYRTCLHIPLQQTNNLALPRTWEKDSVNAQSEECSVPRGHYDIGVPNKG